MIIIEYAIYGHINYLYDIIYNRDIYNLLRITVAKYTFDQVKRNVAEIANRNSYTKDFIFELMAAYGRAASAINQLRAGTINKATDPDALLQKGVLYFKVFPQGTPLEEKVEEMDFEPLSGRYEPRYIIATDLHHIVAKDITKHTTLDIEIKDIDNEVAFFYGWTGNEINEGSADESAADRRAADKMKDLYDEIERENINDFQANPVEFRHDLNVFFSRLLFCFFAEDTGLFKQKQFTNSIKEYTETDGSDLNLFFEELFKSLNSEDKSGMTTPYSEFPYVNGSLFDTKEHNIAIPKFSPTARHILILCGDLDWSGVNPDIFGTIFQGIVDETRRDENGMDYTSVPNILKVINPLFMNELNEEFDKAFDDQSKLFKLLIRISKIKVFDPACGSGNFLIISYKKMRELEHDVIRRIVELKHGIVVAGLKSLIKLDHFFGIELEDFPRELAVLSMYIAAHQMNIEFEKEFGKKLSIIPLIDMPTIYCDNSIRKDWDDVCRNNGNDEIYIIGNPPYKGSKKQTSSMKSDFEFYFDGEEYSKNLDYIALWFIKGARYISGTKAKLAFVSTNSICQGEHVGIMFPKIYTKNVDIEFAYSSFKWRNNAKDNAGVTVIVVGLANKNNSKKKLYSDELIQEAQNINAYLAPSDNNTIVYRRSNVLTSYLPPIYFGNMPIDGGNFILDNEQVTMVPECYKKFIKKYIGAEELLHGKMRYCLWIEQEDLDEAKTCDFINSRIESVKKFRLESKRKETNKIANTPWKFSFIAYNGSSSIIIPGTSSENREYIPMDMVGPDTIASNLALAIYDAEPWLFSILQSRIHMAWIKTVCGKLKTDYRYSSTLGYNTFPCPPLTEQQKEKLNLSARNILFARANHPELTLADMYDPNEMPKDLRQAHESNDILVDKLYRSTPFRTDEARLATLFKLYEEMTWRE